MRRPGRARAGPKRDRALRLDAYGCRPTGCRPTPGGARRRHPGSTGRALPRDANGAIWMAKPGAVTATVHQCGPGVPAGAGGFERRAERPPHTPERLRAFRSPPVCEIAPSTDTLIRGGRVRAASTAAGAGELARRRLPSRAHPRDLERPARMTRHASPVEPEPVPGPGSGSRGLRPSFPRKRDPHRPARRRRSRGRSG